MAWDVLAETGRMWRVRAQVADDPGRLAALATGLSEQGCNLLGVTVLPVAAASTSPSWSYNGHLDVGIIVCPDVVPDVWKLATHLREALAELHDVTAPGAAQPAPGVVAVGAS